MNPKTPHCWTKWSNSPTKKDAVPLARRLRSYSIDQRLAKSLGNHTPQSKSASAQLAKALGWLSRNEQITPTSGDYLDGAIIKATARKQGAIVELTDCLIAAVAVRLQVPLATANTKDFRAIRNTGAALIIENWREPQRAPPEPDSS